MQTKHDISGTDEHNIKDINTPDLKGPGRERMRKKICQLLCDES